MSTTEQDMRRRMAEVQAEQGYGSPIWQKEWNLFLQERQRMADHMLGRLELGSNLVGAGVLPNNAASQSVVDVSMGQVWQGTQAERIETFGGHAAMNDLIGAARAHGIPNPEKIPARELAELVTDARFRMQTNQRGQFVGGGSDEDAGLSMVGALLTAPTHTILRMMQRIPFIGDQLARTEAVQFADQRFSQVNEQLRMDLSPEMQAGLGFSRGAFGMVGYALPSALTYGALGAAGYTPFAAKYGAKLPMFARAAIKTLSEQNKLALAARTALQGSATAWAFEGGGDNPVFPTAEIIEQALSGNRDAMLEAMSTRSGLIATGGAAAIAFEMVLPQLLGKIRRSMPSKVYEGEIMAEGWSPTQAPRPGQQGPVVEGEWAMQRQIGGPSGRLGPIVEGQVQPNPVRSQPALSTGYYEGGPPAAPRRLGPGGEPVVGQPGDPTVAVPRGVTIRPATAPQGYTRGNGIDFIYDGPNGPVFGQGIIRANGELYISDIGTMNKTGDGTSAGSVGHSAMRQIGKQLVMDLRAQGMDVQSVGGLRITGIRRESGIPATNWVDEMDDPLRANISADRLLRTKPLSVADAAEEAITLSHHTTLLESPAIAEMAVQPTFDHADVAVAAVAANPGQINLIRNVGDVAQTVARLTRQQAGKTLSPTQFRVIEREVNGKVTHDILISDGLPITNKRVAQYKEHGLFEGQQAKTAFGNDVVVKGFQQAYQRSPAGSQMMVEVYSPYSKNTYLIYPEELFPGETSFGGAEGVGPGAEKIYKHLKVYTESVMNEEMASAGLPAVGWLDEPTTSQLPRMLEDFLTQNKIMNPTTRNAITNYVDLRRAQEFKASAPAEDLAFAEQIANEVAELPQKLLTPGAWWEGNLAKPAVEPMLAYPITLTMADVASTKGLKWLPDADGEGGVIQDRLSDLEILMESEDAAAEFITRFNREMPDITPNSDVPMEIMDMAPFSVGAATDNLAGTPDLELYTESYIEGVHNLIEDLQESILAAEEAAQAVSGNAAGFEGAAVNPPVLWQPSVPSAQMPTAGGPPAPPPPPVWQAPAAPPPPPPAVPNAATWGQQIRALQAANPHGAAVVQELERMHNSLLAQLIHPHRTMMIKLENFNKANGLTEGKTWDWYNNISTNLNLMHNEANPYYEMVADIISPQRRAFRRKVVMDVQMLPAQARQAAMAQRGFSRDEMIAQGSINPYYDALTGFAGAGDRIHEYLANVRAQMAANAPDAYADTTGLLRGTPVANFESFARYSQLNPHQLDVGIVMSNYTRAVMFQRYVEPSWRVMAEQVLEKQQGRYVIPTEIRAPLAEWLELVKTGHQPGRDKLVNGVQYILNKIDPTINSGDARALIRGMITASYRGMLGLRPDVIFRDLINPLLGGSRYGFGPQIQAYREVINPATRGASLQRGYDGGWIIKGMVQVPTSEMFGQQQLTPQGAILHQPGVVKRGITAAMDLGYAFVPRRLRGGVQGTWLDPLYWYTQEGMFNRWVSGEAGWQLIKPVVENFRAGNISHQDLMESQAVRIWPSPVRDKFEALITSGQDGEAMNLIANEAANSQNRYGSIESPAGLRTMTGKMGIQLGTFAQQYAAYNAEALSNGLYRDRAAFLVRQGSVLGILGLTAAATGWNFYKWMWPLSLTYVGSPIIEAVTGMWQAAFGAAAELTPGAEPSWPQQAAMSDFHPMQGFLESINPVAGGVRTVQRANQTAVYANRPSQWVRLALTGQAGQAMDFEQQLQESWRGTGGYPQTPAHINNRQLTPEQQVLMLQNTPPGGGAR